MQRKIQIFILFMFSFAAYSQDEIKSQDPLAEPYLENIAKNFRTDKAYQAEFRYEIYSSVENARMGDYGSIIVKENKYKLRTEDTEILFNGQYLWVYNREAAEVYKSTPLEGDMDQMLADPFRLLGNYREYYKYLYKGEKKIEGLSYSEIDLYPIDLESGYSILRVVCRNKGESIYSISLKQKNGTEITAFITDIVHNLTITDTLFNWDEQANPDILVIEM